MGICGSTNKKGQQSTKAYQIQDFKLESLLGKGGFGEVWKVQQRKTKKRYALKVLDKAQIIFKKSVKQILTERMILTKFLQLKCKGIINMECAFQDKRKLYILMQYIEGKTLRQIFQNQCIFKENQQKFIIFSLVKILESLYENKIIHHDFKPQNIMIDKDGNPILLDFGLSSFCYEDNSHITGGTLEYIAPQILSNYNHYYTADYYSLGVIVYQTFFKKRPYSAKKISAMINIQKQKPFNQENFPEIKSLDPLAKDFLLGLLQKTQIKRLGYNGIHQLLEHPWLKDVSQSIPNGLISKSYLQNTAVSREDETLSSKSSIKHVSIPILTNLLKESYIQCTLNHNLEMFQNFDFTPIKNNSLSISQT